VLKSKCWREQKGIAGIDKVFHPHIETVVLVYAIRFALPVFGTD